MGRMQLLALGLIKDEALQCQQVQSCKPNVTSNWATGQECPQHMVYVLTSSSSQPGANRCVSVGARTKLMVKGNLHISICVRVG